MADTAGQALIRGINLDKKARNYQNEESIFYKEINVNQSSSREINYYQRTSGYLTATSPASIVIAEGSTPFVLETSWTKNISYTKKYAIDSPMISIEDEKGSEVKVFMDNLEEITGAVINERDGDIWEIATESQSPVNINSVTSTAAWDAASGQDPMADVAEAIQKIREQTKRKVKDLKLYVSAKGEKDLKVWITNQGASWTELASKTVIDGVLTRFGGCQVVVSENVTADYALVADLRKSTEYWEFISLGTAIITEERIGKKIRVTTNGIAVLTMPKFNTLISNTET
jgi:hypothetical protein